MTAEQGFCAPEIMITVEFSQCEEIRMGSPFQICNLHLSGEWTPVLNTEDWQPIYARSHDGRHLALVKWDTKNNQPGFRVTLVDEVQRTVEESQTLPGCCESLKWEGNVISWKAFPDFQGTITLPFCG